MAKHNVRESDGWAGIAKALSVAAHGDEVILGPGQYSGNEELSIPAGVILTGCADAQLEFTGDETAIDAGNANDVVIQHIRLRAYRHLSHISYEEGVENPPGLITIRYSSNVVVRGCDIHTYALRRASICAVHASELQISENVIRGGGIGISLLSSTGKITNNTAIDGIIGILLSIHLCHLLSSSAATIENNKLIDNTHAAIGLASSSSDSIRENYCLGGFAGIQVQMHGEKLQSPSDAKIARNHCIGQILAGIAIPSSYSATIEDNICHGSQEHGIILSTDPRAPGSRSVAERISGNRCHDNAGSGIWLGSAYGGVIAANKCWANGETGIQLTRNIGAPETPARAAIHDNFLLANGAAGISVQGSESGGIINNACLRNRGCGIDIVASAEAGNAPSQADVRDNRLQSNGGKAVHFVGSSGEATHNRSKGNITDGVTVEAVPFALRSSTFGQAPATPRIADNTTDEKLDLTSLLLPELRAALRSSIKGRSLDEFYDEGLARFLSTGSAGSFRAFWTGHEHAAEPGTSSDAVSARRRWSLSGVGHGMSFEPRPQRSETLKDELLKNIDQAVRASMATDAHKGHWLAAVISDDRDGDDIRSGLAARDNRGIGGYVPPGGLRSAPLIVEQGIGATPLRDVLSSALMRGRSKTAIRAIELGRLAIWPALLAVLLVGGTSLTPWGQSAAAAIVPEGMWERGILMVTIVAVAIASLSIIDLLMPTHLRAGSRSRDRDNAFEEFVQALGGTAAGLLRAAGKLIPEGRREIWARWADLRWQRRHLFRGANISSLYLADTAGWHPTDADWLKRHVAALGSDEQLVTLIELDGRLSIRPVLVDVEDAPWARAVDIYLFDDDERLRLSSTSEVDSKTAAPDVLGLSHTEESEKVENELVDDRWTPTDMIPTLPIASAPTLRARISRLKTDNRDLLEGQALVSLVYPAAKGLFTTDDRALLLDAAAIKRPFELSGQLRALRRFSAHEGRQHFEHLVGRAGYRREVAERLRKLWPAEEDWQEYVASALRFGIWHGLTQVENLLLQPDDRYAELAARRALEGIGFLGRDLSAIAHDNVRLHGETEFYQPAWAQLSAAIKTLPQSPGRAELIKAFLAAQALCNQIDPALMKSILDSVEAALLDPLESATSQPATAVEAFCRAEARRITQINDLDPAERQSAIARAKASVWSNLPDEMLNQFDAWANGLGANPRSLSMLFASARDAAQIEQLISTHAYHAERTMFALANAATNHLIANRVGLDPDPNDPQLLTIARTMVKLRGAWLKAGRHTELASTFAAGAAGIPAPAQAAADYFAAEDAAERISALLRPSPAEMLDAIEGKLELEIAS